MIIQAQVSQKCQIYIPIMDIEIVAYVNDGFKIWSFKAMFQQNFIFRSKFGTAEKFDPDVVKLDGTGFTYQWVFAYGIYCPEQWRYDEDILHKISVAPKGGASEL